MKAMVKSVEFVCDEVVALTFSNDMIAFVIKDEYDKHSDEIAVSDFDMVISEFDSEVIDLKSIA